MKPKIGRKVYCIYGECILVETVGFVGKDSFIIENFNVSVCDNSLEWFYEDYNNEWFTSLTRAKKALIDKCSDKYDGKIKIFKVSDSAYILDV